MNQLAVTILVSGSLPGKLTPALASLAQDIGLEAYQLHLTGDLAADSRLLVHVRRGDRWAREIETTWGEVLRGLERVAGEDEVRNARLLCPESSLPECVRALHRLRKRILSKWGHLPFLVLPLDSLSSEDKTRSDRSPILEESVQRRLETLLHGSDGPILLEGRTGTGKTEVAQIIHRMQRETAPFRVVNAAALGGAQGQIRESLFRGIQNNRFSGVTGYRSLFEEHDQGTVLLDDFQDYPLEDQATLLDMVHPLSNSMTGYLLGETKEAWRANVQILIAVNENRDTLLRAKRLREDLHFRVRRTLHLPSLKEILDGAGSEAESLLRDYIVCMQERSIGSLLRFPSHAFADVLRRLLYLESPPPQQEPGPQHGPRPQTFWRGAGRPLSLAPIPAQALQYAWPGNFRELENMAVSLLETTGTVGVWSADALLSVLGETKRSSEHLASLHATDAQSTDLEAAWSPAELIARAHLQALETNRTLQGAAAALFVDVRTLRQRLRRLIQGKWFIGSTRNGEATAGELVQNETLERLQSAARHYIRGTEDE